MYKNEIYIDKFNTLGKIFFLKNAFYIDSNEYNRCDCWQKINKTIGLYNF